MIDAGRRFFPMPLVRNLLDTMVGNKMNVLHLHASDMCRFGVESKAFPKRGLIGPKTGFNMAQNTANEMGFVAFLDFLM